MFNLGAEHFGALLHTAKKGLVRDNGGPRGEDRSVVATPEKLDGLQAGQPQRGHARLRVGANGIFGQPPLDRNLDYYSGEVILRDRNVLDAANAKAQVLDVCAFVEAADRRVGLDVIGIALVQEMAASDDDEEQREDGERNQEEDAQAYLLCSGSHKTLWNKS